MKKCIGFLIALCLLVGLLPAGVLALELPEIEDIPATGGICLPGFHDYSIYHATEPACTADGWGTYECSRCGDSYDVDYTDPNVVAVSPYLRTVAGNAITEYGPDFIVFMTNSRVRGQNIEEDYTTPVVVPAEEYETMVRKYFVVNHSDITALRSFKPANDDLMMPENALTYDKTDNVYVVMPVGGWGGWVAGRTYQGYVERDGIYEFYYADTNYRYLADYLPDDVNEAEYTKELGTPETLQYADIEFVLSPDGIYYNLESIENTGRKGIVEYNGDAVRIIDIVPYEAKDLPEAFDDRDGKAVGHDWDEGVITVEPTEETSGERVRVCRVCAEQTREIVPPLKEVPDFRDVPADAWYVDAVNWAVELGVTSGVASDRFAPEQVCTRAQVVTFLWRAAGCPSAQSEENPFTDVKKGDYFYDAVLWAVEQGITSGVSDNSFAPERSCTRAQVAAFLWRAAGEPPHHMRDPIFSDIPVGIWYQTAVLWAVECQITSGVAQGSFAPDDPCTRAQIVTFLYRAKSGV